MSERCTYHIVYPQGDMSKLSVVKLSWSSSHELSDYCVASRKAFGDHEEAADWAQELAKKHGLEYKRQQFDEHGKETFYLD